MKKSFPSKVPHKFLTALAMFLFYALPSYAVAETEERRLIPYEPSSFLWRIPLDRSQDDMGWRIHYSFKYLLLRPSPDGIKYDVFIKYTGEFDFYMGQRPSGPVINRVSNPGVHVELDPSNLVEYLSDLNSVNVGFLEHESDGQVTEVNGATNAAKAQAAYDIQDYQYFDGISRGSNFTSLELKFDYKFPLFAESNRLKLYLKGKKYWTQDYNVTWGPMANQGLKLSNYDRYRVVITFVNHEKSPRIETAIVWTVGDDLFKHDSVDANFAWHIVKDRFDMPLYANCHVGPLYSLSNYTETVNWCGIGLKLIPIFGKR